MIKQTMVRYTVKPERVAEHELLIANVFDQIKQEQPDGIRYASFRLADGLTFVHVSANEVVDGVNPLVELSAFKTFVANISDRCDVQPVTTEFHTIGTHGVLGE